MEGVMGESRGGKMFLKSLFFRSWCVAYRLGIFSLSSPTSPPTIVGMNKDLFYFI